jgi:hypothetical protein
VGVAIVGQAQQSISKAARGELLVHLEPAVLAEGVGEFQRVQLHICVAVRQPLDHGGHGLLCACLCRADLVAYVEYVLPILACQVFVGGLDHDIVK